MSPKIIPVDIFRGQANRNVHFARLRHLSVLLSPEGLELRLVQLL